MVDELGAESEGTASGMEKMSVGERAARMAGGAEQQEKSSGTEQG